MTLTDLQRESLAARLAGELPEGAVRADEETRTEWFDDYTEIEGHLPDVVVQVTSAEQVEAVLRIATAERVPVVPALASSNVGGLCIPDHGGILMDMMGMNRILEVFEEDLVMVVEPGVTWQQVKDYLDEHHPGLRFGYSLSPPDTTVLGNCLMDGLSNLSLRWGSMGDWLNGLEVVLPDGERLRTGGFSWNDYPVTPAPMPRLEGLFVNWHGTTGVVVKAAIEVQVKPRNRARCFYFGRDIPDTFRFINAVARAEICDDLAGLSWPLGKMLFGDPRPVWRQEGEPRVIVFVDYSADDDELFAAKGRAIERLAAGFRDGGATIEGPLHIEDLLALEPRFNKFADWPMRLEFMVDHPGGGLSWVGTYGPASRFPESVQACHDLMAERGFPPAVVTRVMRGGHFGVLRMITTFDKKDPEEVACVARLNEEIADLAFSMGYVPYKTPRWALERYRDRLDPGFQKLLSKLKRAVDPHGILNPGRWGFAPPS